eukprot:TRINITY_DN13909_c0_g1_i1.p1 TRINITY_DN13909_c0_g1~~TRINITY_DN13909_c0_g1_i1.p1  ORF type:complete len:2259 (-),score=552.00 TRINITY_DN13909_c0_g1_i1:69-6794(-)
MVLRSTVTLALLAVSLCPWTFVLAARVLPEHSSYYTSLVQTHAFIQKKKRRAKSATVPLLRPKLQLSPQKFHSAVHRESSEVCGTRLLLLPQLRLHLEIFHRIGLFRATGAECAAPKLALLSVSAPVLGDVHHRGDGLLAEDDGWTQYTAGAAGFVQVFWALAALFLVLSQAWSWENPAVVGAIAARAKSWRQGDTETKGGRRRGLWGTFLESLSVSSLGIHASRETDAGAAEECDGAAAQLRSAWRAELQRHGKDGAERASLLRALCAFLGRRALLSIGAASACAALVDTVGLSVALDLLLHYAQSANNGDYDPFKVGQVLSVVAVIALGFSIPMLARVLVIISKLLDGHHGSRMACGLLALIFEKATFVQLRTDLGAQDPLAEDPHAPPPSKVSLIQLLNNDIVQAIPGALRSVALSVAVPLCMLVLLRIFVLRLGTAAAYGVLVSAWIPILHCLLQRRAAHKRVTWGRLADTKLRLLHDTLAQIRGIKAMAFELGASERVCNMRERELEALESVFLLQCVLETLCGAYPLVVVISSLSFQHLLHGTVSAGHILICMRFLSGFFCCSRMCSDSLWTTANAWHSLRRLERFLRDSELNSLPPSALPASAQAPAPKAAALAELPQAAKAKAHVRVRGSFAYAGSEQAALRSIDLSVEKGELVAVVGDIASGKSALLLSILGELDGTEGSVAAVDGPREGISYCAQVPWVLDGSLRDNVTFGAPYDDWRYREALSSAALPDEVKMESTEVAPQKGPGKKGDPENFPFFALWNALGVLVLVLNIFNVDWDNTPHRLGAFVVLIQGILHWSVLELPLITLVALASEPKVEQRADGSHITCVLNYNLLAVTEPMVDECLLAQYEAYMGNLSKNYSAVLVSATNDKELKKYELKVRDDYRERIREELLEEGKAWAEGEEVDEGRTRRVWSKYAHLDRTDFVENHLPELVEYFVKDFMVVHRVTRVLRKCGQYQDLMLLSAGYEDAYTYTDEFYGKKARKGGEPLFEPSEDTQNCKGRFWDYTMVLDADTGVHPDSLEQMMDIAAGNPYRAVIQPSIKMTANPDDTFYTHLEAARSRINGPLDAGLMGTLGRSAFFGKGILKNQAYIERCLGSPTRPIERVPIDVLSHDTYEAAVMCPLYSSSTFLWEAPCGDYISWDVREGRWNRGEVLLACYFWPDTIGKLVAWLNKKLIKGHDGKQTPVRLDTVLDSKASHLAHSALRQMCMKPLMLLYICLFSMVRTHYPLAPFVLIMFFLICFPKFATMNRYNWHAVILETTCAILQFTPEAVVGTVRVIRAVKCHVTGNSNWVPQALIDAEMKSQNPFVFATRYLWQYALLGMIVIYKCKDINGCQFLILMMFTVAVLPLYVAITALPANKLGMDVFLQDFPRPEAKEPAAAKEEEKEKQAEAESKDSDFQNVSFRPAPPVQLVKPAPPKQENLKVPSLSNSDRARISLARAAYKAPCDVVLLDDPFATLDSDTANHVLDRLIRGPLMRNATRLVVLPPNAEHLLRFDRVVVLSQGSIAAQGPPAVVLQHQAFREFHGTLNLPPLPRALQDPTQPQQSRGGLAIAAGGGELQLQKPEREHQQQKEELSLSRSTFTGLNMLPNDEAQKLPVVGIFSDSLSAAGEWYLPQLGILMFISCFGLQVVYALLGRWAQATWRESDLEYFLHQEVPKESHAAAYLPWIWFFAIFAGCMEIIIGYFVTGSSIHVSNHIFRTGVKNALNGKVDSYWDQCSVGRAINRLSGDMLRVDVTLTIGATAALHFLGIVTVFVIFCFAAAPWWMMGPLYVLLIRMARFFVMAVRSMIYRAVLVLSECQDQISDLGRIRVPVRANGHHEATTRRFCQPVNSAIRTLFLGTLQAKVWLAFHASLSLCFVMTSLVFLGISEPMILITTFSITQHIDCFLDCIVRILSLAISFQRLQEFIGVPQELADDLFEGEEGQLQTMNGLRESDVRKELTRLVGAGTRIQFENISASYGFGIPVLTDICLDVAPRSKLGLCGAPGSGKSTLLLCLLRILEPRCGRILLGGTNIKGLRLHTLRRMITFVSQNPVLFEASIRDNLDQFKQFTDERVWQVVRSTGLHLALPCAGGSAAAQGAVAASSPAAQRILASVLVDNGANLSAGQRQLLALARAVCAQPALLLIDDCPTIMQQCPVVRENGIGTLLPYSTVVSATSRAECLLDCDCIAVLENGRIVEKGDTAELLKNEDSAFRRLLSPAALPSARSGGSSEQVWRRTAEGVWRMT